MFNPMFQNMYNNFIKGFYYTVQENDTLEIISKRYKVPVNQIITANKLTYPYILKEGSRIVILGRDEPIAPDGGSIYTVKYGDNLDRISKKFDVSIDELLEKNYLSNKHSIYIGQKLLIPSKKNIENNATQNDVKKDSQINEVKDEKDEIKIYPLGSDIPSIGTKQHNPNQYSPNQYNQNSMKSTLNNKFSMLKKGDKDKKVATLKRLVSALGYNIRKIDGYFDSNLEQQIKKIQKDAGFEQTGYADQNIWEYIFNSVNNLPGMYN